MPAANPEDRIVKLPGGRRLKVSRPPEEVEISAKATFKFGSNSEYRKLLELFAAAGPIKCTTAEGFAFELAT